MTFRAYLMTRRDGAGPTAEFVRLARAHSALSGVWSLRELHSRLEDGGASPGLYEAARQVWQEYQDAPHPADA